MNAFWGILIASIIIFMTGITIAYYTAKYNIGIDLLTRASGFGYFGSTITSLIYASFSLHLKQRFWLKPYYCTQVFHCILMDCQMPVMDGLEATRAIRKMKGYDDLPILAMSAGVTKEEQAACIDSGMNDFIPKPIRIKALQSILEKWFDETINH